MTTTLNLGSPSRSRWGKGDLAHLRTSRHLSPPCLRGRFCVGIQDASDTRRYRWLTQTRPFKSSKTTANNMGSPLSISLETTELLPSAPEARHLCRNRHKQTPSPVRGGMAGARAANPGEHFAPDVASERMIGGSTNMPTLRAWRLAPGVAACRQTAANFITLTGRKMAAFCRKPLRRPAQRRRRGAVEGARDSSRFAVRTVPGYGTRRAGGR